MIVLALDTTSRAGSAALVQDGTLLAEATGDPSATHGQRLPGELIALLARAQRTLADVDLFAVAAGPGSFTGLRVGIAVMQGLSMATGKPIVPVSTLEALAQAAGPGPDTVIAPWVDAQRGQVFAALYEADGRTAVAEPTSLTPADTVRLQHAQARGQRIRFIGDGAVRYRAEIAAALGERGDVDATAPHLAFPIARIAAASPERAVPPHAVMPIYVRRPDAELARERRAQGA